MTRRSLTLRGTAADDDVRGGSVGGEKDLLRRFDAVRAKAGVVVEFPPSVLQAAEAAARETPLPDEDLTSIPFVTLDPPGATDLDQALHLARDGEGYAVEYAIADVPAFLDPAGPIAAEARKRGQTVYAPDRKAPLHPSVLSEGAASLLEGQERSAFVWGFTLDAAAQVTGVTLRRARVRSRAQLDYPTMQRAVDGGATETDLTEVATLLREIGTKRQQLERERGGASLPLPDQEVVHGETGYDLQIRPLLPVEDWNAQLSLMTGIAAASIMLAGRVGVLRTLPAPAEGAIEEYRRLAGHLGVPWPEGLSYGAFLATLDPTVPAHLGLLNAATSLFRGSGYSCFDGEPPADPVHAAVAAPYAHVTAPLRRLVDRFGLVTCLALHRGEEVPAWVKEAFAWLAEAMASSGHRASEVENGCLDVVEAVLLESRVGETFEAVVIAADRDGGGGRVQLVAPAVVAKVTGKVALGEAVRVKLEAADPDGPTVRFTAVR